jgi:DNA-binding transcriptional ArsR family regulator
VAARQADTVPTRPRPRPGPVDGAEPDRATPNPASPPARRLAIPEPPPAAQVVAAAGNAIVTAAKLGRILGRSGWRIARQLPVVGAVEREAQRLRKTAAARYPAPSGDEERVVRLVQDAQTDPEPLRTAMTELLERSAESDETHSRDYLFGSIISQLVPDEARILAALATGERFAVLDVLAKTSRTTTRPVLTNVSTVAAAARVAAPEKVGTYLDRLRAFGLIESTPAGDELSPQFDALLADPAVKRARTQLDASRHGSKVNRTTVALSSLGREFWAVCAPKSAGLRRRSG